MARQTRFTSCTCTSVQLKHWRRKCSLRSLSLTRLHVFAGQNVGSPNRFVGYVRAEFASYVNEAIIDTLRITLEAINNDGEACIETDTPELVNAEQLRTYLSMQEIYSHLLVFDRVMVFNDSKVFDLPILYLL